MLPAGESPIPSPTPVCVPPPQPDGLARWIRLPVGLRRLASSALNAGPDHPSRVNPLLPKRQMQPISEILKFTKSISLA